MSYFEWDPEKNQRLLRERNVSFEDVVFCLGGGGLLDDIPHPNHEKYPNQRVFIVNIDGYAYLVPYVNSENGLFLKTIIPSRKATRNDLGEMS